MREVFVVDAARTAIGGFGGSLAEVDPACLAGHLLRALLARNRLDAAAVDEVILGNVLQAGHGQNIARQAAVDAQIPVEKTALSVNMVCGSGLRAVAMAAQSIALGDADCILAGGAESMSLAPYLLPKARYGYRLGHGELLDSMIHDGLWDIFGRSHMGITAERLAKQYGIGREEQDRFAAASHNKAERAIGAGVFKEEILPIPVPQRKGEPVDFSRDEHVRLGSTVEALAKLSPAFDPQAGTVTAGNSSGINDGAACLLVAGEESVSHHRLRPLARIVSYGWHGVEPAIMGIGPVEAVRKALRKAGWRLEDLDLIESNEAFAAQAIAVNRELGWDVSRVNVNGGAIALGHPIGASGARILVTLLFEMRRRAARKGLAALCIGGGMGIALCVEGLW